MQSRQRRTLLTLKWQSDLQRPKTTPSQRPAQRFSCWWKKASPVSYVPLATQEHVETTNETFSAKWGVQIRPEWTQERVAATVISVNLL